MYTRARSNTDILADVETIKIQETNLIVFFKEYSFKPRVFDTCADSLTFEVTEDE